MGESKENKEIWGKNDEEKRSFNVIRPIQEEPRSTRLKLEELQSTKKTNKQNKNFLYSYTKEIVQELKGPLDKCKQLKFAQKELMNALSTWIEAFNELPFYSIC